MKHSLSIRVFLAILAFGIVMGIALMAPHVPDIDENAYRHMAEGHVQEVCRPYSSRILHPFLLRALVGFGLTHESCGVVLNVVSGIVLLSCLLLLLRRVFPPSLEESTTCGWRKFAWELHVFGLLCVPIWWTWSTGRYMHDFFATAVSAVLFLVLIPPKSVAREGESEGRISGGRLALVFCLLVILQMTRESTWVLTIVLTVLAIRRRQFRLALLSLLALFAGSAAVAWVSHGAPGPVTGLPLPLYLLSKALANGCANLLGVTPWNDAYARMLPLMYPDEPVWQIALPFRVGNISAVGIYSFSPSVVWSTFGHWLLVFPGALLLLVYTLLLKFEARICGKGDLTMRKNVPLGVQLALIAGFIYWLSVPFAGRSGFRLIGYAWPLFWIAIPYFHFRQIESRRDPKWTSGE